MNIDEALVRQIVMQVLALREKSEPEGTKDFLEAEQTCPVIFGVGALAKVGQKAKALGISKVLIVTDPGIVKIGLADKVKGYLESEGLQTVLFDQVHPNPVDSDCNDGGELAIKEKVNGIVAIGGGSVMDSGKAIKILSANKPPISQYYGTFNYNTGVPLILIPTTAGTGSEVTKYAVLTDSVTHEKKVALIKGDLAICDPEISYKLPKGLTASTGMDVLAHACESYAGGVHNPKADVLALEAIQRIAKWLPKAYSGESNETARYEVMLACNFAGMAFNETICHLGHATAHSIGATFNIPHGTCCAWTLPETMVFCAGLYPYRVKKIADALGLSYPADAPGDVVGKIVADGIRSLMRTLEMKSLKAAGIERDALINISGLVMKDFCYPVIPVKLSEAQIKDFLAKVYDTYQ
jgi:alcohol dehydrogenase class IV